ncbi:Rad3-related DNA helicase [Lachnospiraceae bacterium RM5]|nr:Rad3-related DNA helicase [Lachnospiraceae bacterium RM5]
MSETSDINKADEKKADVKISVRDLVEFIMRSGDIDNRSMGKLSVNAMNKGSEIHRKLQKKEKEGYLAEVPLKYIADISEYKILLEGRADGIFIKEKNEAGIIKEVTVIDEIKGTYKNLSKLDEPVKEHKAQVLLYAFMYLEINKLEEIDTRITYVNMEDESIKRFDFSYTKDEVSKEALDILNQYKKWVVYINEHRLKVKKSIEKIVFPFEYRQGQKTIMKNVYEAIENEERLFLQAPTGVGKTISVIYPALKSYLENRIEKIFFLTAKTITRTVAKETFDILRNNNLIFKTVEIVAKEKICPLDECVCNPEKCMRAKGHFDRVNEGILNILENESAINREVIEKYSEKFNICPFEYSLDISMFVDGVICDYNYVFDPRARLKRYFIQGIKNDFIFLVDEAHNLVERGRDMYSARLVKEDFLACKKIVGDMDKGVKNALNKCNKEMLELKRECVGTGKYSYTIIDDPIFLENALRKLERHLERFLDLRKEFKDRDKVLEMYFNIKSFLDIYGLVDENYIIYTDFDDDNNFFVKLYCVRPAKNLKECMECGKSTVMFSATLLPVDYYKKMLTDSMDDKAVYVLSPFDESKRLLAITRDVTSKYTKRGYDEYNKIACYIDKVTKKVNGNYMIFFPSYKMMEDIYVLIKQENYLKKYELILQKMNMTEEEREEFLEKFSSGQGNIGFCVMGGIFSEGIDLKEEKLIGAFVVGTGYPGVSSTTEILKNYFDEHGLNGFDFTFKYPGMNKVMQAAGRVIRTESDTGVIFLMDERFLESGFRRMFPREWNDVKVVDLNTVEDKIDRFWKYV